jgi:DNA uptake protein ComE-like DNA-binding protein
MQVKLWSVVLLVTAAACAQQETEQTEALSDTTVAAVAPSADDRLDPNTATPEQLVGVQGVDSTLAAEIVNGRPYADMRSLDAVLSARLDEAQRDQVYARVWQPIDINTAPAEELELIPGVGARMRGEFEEYRPFQSVDHFRTEIGKYVDDEELDRLLSYVVIK